jgi:hypothetical protein
MEGSGQVFRLPLAVSPQAAHRGHPRRDWVPAFVSSIWDRLGRGASLLMGGCVSDGPWWDLGRGWRCDVQLARQNLARDVEKKRGGLEQKWV